MIETTILAWLAIVSGDITARRTGNDWWRAACFAGTILLTWQAWAERIDHVHYHHSGVASASTGRDLAQEVIGSADSDVYHRPDCPMRSEIRYVTGESAELMGRRPCRYCFKQTTVSNPQVSLPAKRGKGMP